MRAPGRCLSAAAHRRPHLPRIPWCAAWPGSVQMRARRPARSRSGGRSRGALPRLTRPATPAGLRPAHRTAGMSCESVPLPRTSRRASAAVALARLQGAPDDRLRAGWLCALRAALPAPGQDLALQLCVCSPRRLAWRRRGGFLAEQADLCVAGSVRAPPSPTATHGRPSAPAASACTGTEAQRGPPCQCTDSQAPGSCSLKLKLVQAKARARLASAPGLSLSYTTPPASK